MWMLRRHQGLGLHALSFSKDNVSIFTGAGGSLQSLYDVNPSEN